MTECNKILLEFPGFGSRKIEADFSGGQVSSDGGVLLLRQVDRWIGLTKRLAELLPDGRDPDRITHALETLLQRFWCKFLMGVCFCPAKRFAGVMQPALRPTFPQRWLASRLLV